MLFNHEKYLLDHAALKAELIGEPFDAAWRKTVNERWSHFLVERGSNNAGAILRSLRMIKAPYMEEYRRHISALLGVVIADLYTATALLLHGVGVNDPVEKETTMRLYWAAALQPLRESMDPLANDGQSAA